MGVKRTVAVRFGGQSGEHEVSLVCALAGMAGRDPERYNVLPVGITKNGRWLAGAGAHAALGAAADKALLPGGGIENAAAGEHHDTAEEKAVVSSTAPFSMLNAQSSIDVVFP